MKSKIEKKFRSRYRIVSNGTIFIIQGRFLKWFGWLKLGIVKKLWHGGNVFTLGDPPIGYATKEEAQEMIDAFVAGDMEQRKNTKWRIVRNS